MVEADPTKVMKVVTEIERKMGYIFNSDEVSKIVEYTIWKCELNHKDKTYFYILLENELRDCLMRVCINYLGEQNRCRKEKTKCATCAI